MKGVKIPTAMEHKVVNEQTGKERTVTLYSYVVLMTERDGSEVACLRVDNESSKLGLQKFIERAWPGWRIKAIYRLYEEDFEE